VNGLSKLTLVEAKLFFREPLGLLISFAFPFFLFFILVGVFGNEVEDNPEDAEVWRNVGPSDYYVPTYVGLVVASVGLVTLPLRLAGYRERGVLRRYRAAGLSVPVILGSQVLVAGGMAVLAAAGIVTLSTVLYGTLLPENWPLVLAGAFLGLLTFCAIGMLLGSVLPSARAVQGVGIALFFVMMLISGSGPPREVLASGMRNFSEILPLTHTNLLVQDAWLGFGWNWARAGVTSAFLLVSAALSLRLFRWE
jgi:ABC-2 type transport system permease protein